MSMRNFGMSAKPGTDERQERQGVLAWFDRLLSAVTIGAVFFGFSYGIMVVLPAISRSRADEAASAEFTRTIEAAKARQVKLEADMLLLQRETLQLQKESLELAKKLMGEIKSLRAE
jgi:hypothetical protein